MNKSIKSFLAIVILVISSLVFTGCNISDIFGGVEEHTVTFNLMYSGSTNVDVFVEDGGFVQDLQATREGYNLLGWYSDSTYNFLFNFATPITGDLNLYAKWQISTYTLTLEKNYDDLTQTINYIYGDNITLPTLERNNYTFDGWYLESSFANLANSDNMLNKDITLYAKWSVITYNLSVVSENDLFGTVSLNYTPENNQTAVINATVNEGYEFDGWYIGGTLWNSRQQVNFIANTDLNIVAKYKSFNRTVATVGLTSITYNQLLTEYNLLNMAKYEDIYSKENLLDYTLKLMLENAGDDYDILEYFSKTSMRVNTSIDSNTKTIGARINKPVLPGDVLLFSTYMINKLNYDIYTRFKISIINEQNNIYECSLSNSVQYTYLNGYYILNEEFKSMVQGIDLVLNIIIPSTLNDTILGDNLFINIEFESVQVANNGTNALDATWNTISISDGTYFLTTIIFENEQEFSIDSDKSQWPYEPFINFNEVRVGGNTATLFGFGNSLWIMGTFELNPDGTATILTLSFSDGWPESVKNQHSIVNGNIVYTSYDSIDTTSIRVEGEKIIVSTSTESDDVIIGSAECIFE